MEYTEYHVIRNFFLDIQALVNDLCLLSIRIGRQIRKKNRKKEKGGERK